MNDKDDKKLIAILAKRDGQHTIVELDGGLTLDVWNIAWDYDLGEVFAHVTTNFSPSISDYPGYFFHTHEVFRLLDGATNAEII